MWKKRIKKNAILLVWGQDDGDDVYIERELSTLSNNEYIELTLTHGIPRGVRKDFHVLIWENRAS